MAASSIDLVDETKRSLSATAEDSKIGIKDRVKGKVKQVSIETKQHVDAALATVRGQTWSEPLGKACSVTGGIVKALGNFVPGFGILGGALSLGSKLLNPKASRNDLARAKGENIGTGMGEVREDLEEVKAEVKGLMKEVQQFSQTVGQEVKEMKDVVNRTFDIVVDTRYKVAQTISNLCSQNVCKQKLSKRTAKAHSFWDDTASQINSLQNQFICRMELI